MSLRVFISYSSMDRKVNFEIFRLLEAHDCDVWLHFFDIKSSEVLEQELRKNAQKADIACIPLSPTSAVSRWVNQEIEFALERRNAGLRILPILLQPCNIPERLDNIVGVDVADGLADEAVQIRFVDAVFGSIRTDDALLLFAGKRSEIAKLWG